jgi:dTDP-4-amino-4,6-dideoxygalactose transaminase
MACSDLKMQYVRIKTVLRQRIDTMPKHGSFIIGSEIVEPENGLPASERISPSVFSLPRHPYLTGRDQITMISLLRSNLSFRRKVFSGAYAW